jgi:LuxR family transcriptional regulator, maltose regulon positive regulatory protein
VPESRQPRQAGSTPTGGSSADQLLRARLIERLEDRWAVPLVLLEAAGGFGKTIALLQAMRANEQAPQGTDRLIVCGHADQDATRLAKRLLGAIDADLAPSVTDTEDLAGVLASAIADRFPEQVCLMLDDVHQLLRSTQGAVEESDAVELVRLLLRALPANGHLVLSGRVIPSLPIARLEATDQLVQIGEAELLFTRTEAEALATRYGTSLPEGAASSGWPALVRLALASRRSAPLDFLLEEVVRGLDQPSRTALMVAIWAGGADEALLRQVTDGEVGVDDLLRGVPLLTDLGEGRVRPHDLWSEVGGHLLDPVVQLDLAAKVAEWLVDDGQHERAMELALAIGDVPRARGIVLRGLEGGSAGVGASTAERWIAAFPAEHRDEPELRILRAVRERIDGDLDAAKSEIDTVLSALAGREHPRAEAVAALEAGLIAWLQGDIARLLEMVGIGERLRALGFTSVDWMVDLGHAGFSDLMGDPAHALELAEGIDTSVAPLRVAQLVMRLRSVLPVLLGDTSRAVGHAGQLADFEPGDMSRQLVAAIHWQHGDPEPMRSSVADPPDPAAMTNALDQFLSATYRAVLGAAVGEVFAVGELGALSAGRGRDLALLAIADAATSVAAGNEAEAVRVIEDLADGGGLTDPVVVGELRRNVGLCYPLSARVAAALDGDDIGPTLSTRRELARLFVALRRGATPDWDALPEPAMVLTSFPLRWSAELTCRLAGAGRPEAAALGTYFVDFLGTRAMDALEQVRQEGRVPATAVDAVLAELPPLPPGPVAVKASGPLDVVHTTGVEAEGLRRQRVRELLALLVLRERVSRTEAGDALWPGLDPDRARTNLRLTLTYVRQVLEPDRASGRPSLFVRSNGEEIWLARTDYLEVDVWSIRAALGRGRQLARTGRSHDAHAAYAEAISAWTGPLLMDLRDLADLGAEVTYLDLELARAGAELAEWQLGTEDFDAAVATAERLLTHDPYDERAYGVIIRSLTGLGEIAAAGDVLRRCEQALRELGAEPSPALMRLGASCGLAG